MGWGGEREAGSGGREREERGEKRERKKERERKREGEREGMLVGDGWIDGQTYRHCSFGLVFKM